MAFLNTEGYAADPNNPLYTTGKYPRYVRAEIEIDGSTADGDVFVLARNLPLEAQVVSIDLPAGNPAIAGFSDADVGIFRSAQTGSSQATLDADLLVDGVSFVAERSSATDLLGANIGSFDKTKTIGELLSLNSDQSYQGGVDVGLKVNTQGAGTGKVVFDVKLAFPA